jgi:uncharacterized protein
MEDTDPFRDCYHRPVAPRLTEAEFARWQRDLSAAWPEIERGHGAYAPALAAGLAVLTPLAAVQDGREVSGTARNAFGAAAMAPAADPLTLARLLIHEFQQVKLSAILDLYDLLKPADDRLFPAPWGEEKLHLEGLLRGAYAHLAVTEFWRIRHEDPPGPSAGIAGPRFGQWRADTAEAIETLLDSGSLTSLGTSWVREMRHSLRP